MTRKELDAAIAVVKRAYSGDPTAEALLKKIRSGR